MKEETWSPLQTDQQISEKVTTSSFIWQYHFSLSKDIGEKQGFTKEQKQNFVPRSNAEFQRQFQKLLHLANLEQSKAIELHEIAAPDNNTF